MTVIRDPNNPMYDEFQQQKILERLAKARMPGYVYLLQPIGHNIYKIGCTTNLERRLKGYKSLYKFPVEFIAHIHYEDYQQAEQQWHTKYDKYHLVGEWYVLPDSEVRDFKELGS